MMTTTQKKEEKLIFCGKCKYFDGWGCLHHETMGTYLKTPISPSKKKKLSVYEVNENNDCKFFERKLPKKSFWSKLKFW